MIIFQFGCDRIIRSSAEKAYRTVEVPSFCAQLDARLAAAPPSSLFPVPKYF